MPRSPRSELAAGVHHVYARGNNRQAIYFDDVDRTAYLRILGATVHRCEWRCLAFCLMLNHVHLLIETVRPNLGVGMHRLHGLYAQAFNRRHGRCGHLFQGRYGAVEVRDDAQLWTVAGYIALNPVTAGLCGRPGDWHWGSYRAVMRDGAPSWLDKARLLAYLGASGGDPRRRYAELAQLKGDSPL